MDDVYTLSHTLPLCPQLEVEPGGITSPWDYPNKFVTQFWSKNDAIRENSSGRKGWKLLIGHWVPRSTFKQLHASPFRFFLWISGIFSNVSNWCTATHPSISFHFLQWKFLFAHATLIKKQQDWCAAWIDWGSCTCPQWPSLVVELSQGFWNPAMCLSTKGDCPPSRSRKAAERWLRIATSNYSLNLLISHQQRFQQWLQQSCWCFNVWRDPNPGMSQNTPLGTAESCRQASSVRRGFPAI